jgi:addiction module RelE/StbE family toxin
MRPVKLRYSRRARRQLDNIHAYIHERNPDAATRVIARIRQSTNLLTDFPNLGPHGLVTETRELVVVGLPYIIVYRLAKEDDAFVDILGVYHMAQDRARDFT